jgi:hypothetical protein
MVKLCKLFPAVPQGGRAVANGKNQYESCRVRVLTGIAPAHLPYRLSVWFMLFSHGRLKGDL